MKVILLVALICLTIVKAQGESGCSSDCSQCMLKEGKYICLVCVGKISYHGDCIDIDTRNSNCLLFGESTDCYMCKKGYASPGDDSYSYCLKLPEKAQNSISTRFKGPYLYDYEVQACDRGFPSEDKTACVDWTLDNMPKNCLSGGNLSGGKNGCVRCQYGFIPDGNGSCQIAPSGLYGCLQEDGHGGCAMCDIYQGWRMNVPGRCVQVY